MYNKVELCGVNTAELPVLSEQEKRQLGRSRHFMNHAVAFQII